MWPFNKNIVSFEEQLSKLNQCGIKQSSSATIDDLYIWGDKDKIEKTPYITLVEAFASDIEREPYSPVCNKLWMCDYERIEDHGAYAEIIERLELMTNNSLGLENISDYVDVEEEKAWIQFEYKGQTIKWVAKIDNDWMDPDIIVKYDLLLKESGSDTRIYSNHTDYGQVAFFAGLSEEEYTCLKKLSPIKLSLIEN